MFATISGKADNGFSSVQLGLLVAIFVIVLAILLVCVANVIMHWKVNRRSVATELSPSPQTHDEMETLLSNDQNSISEELTELRDNNASLRQCCDDLRTAVDKLRISHPEDNANGIIQVQGDYNQNCRITKMLQNTVSVTPDACGHDNNPFQSVNPKQRALPHHPDQVERADDDRQEEMLQTGGATAAEKDSSSNK